MYIQRHSPAEAATRRKVKVSVRDNPRSLPFHRLTHERERERETGRERHRETDRDRERQREIDRRVIDRKKEQ